MSALTRLAAESVLVRRVGKLLAAADLDDTASAANHDLNDPMGWALRQLGHTVTTLLAVSDDDLSAVGGDELDEFLDLAELRTLETIRQSLDDVDLRVGPRAESYSQLAAQVDRIIEAKTAAVAKAYGRGYDVSAAPIRLHIAESE